MPPAFSVAVLLVLGLLTWKQGGMYTDSETLYRTTIKKNPGCWMAHNNLGLLLANSGRQDEAIAHYRNAIEINPLYIETHNNLGVILEKTGQIDEAIAHYVKALEINSNYVVARYNLGRSLIRAGRTDEAVAHINAVSEYAVALAHAGHTAEAIRLFGNALELASLSGREALVEKITADIKNSYQSSLQGREKTN